MIIVMNTKGTSILMTPRDAWNVTLRAFPWFSDAVISCAPKFDLCFFKCVRNCQGLNNFPNDNQTLPDNLFLCNEMVFNLVNYDLLSLTLKTDCSHVALQ